mgnify:CR=1 FL=1
MPRMRALSMSVLLAENTPHNGPLMLIPGSHRQYLTCVGETPEDHYRQSLKRQEYGVPDGESLTKLAQQGGIVGPAPKARRPTMAIAAPNSSLMMSHSTYQRNRTPNLANVGQALMKSETMMPAKASNTSKENNCVSRWNKPSCKR